MLVLERDKSMADEMSEIEKKAIVGRVLIIEHYLTVIDEFDLLRQGWKSIIVFAILNGLDKWLILVIRLVVLSNDNVLCIINNL